MGKEKKNVETSDQTKTKVRREEKKVYEEKSNSGKVLRFLKGS